MKCFIKRPLKPKASSSETMTEIAEQIGEYFSADEVNSLGYQASLVKENNAPKKLLSKIKNLLEINNEQLAPQAEVYEINGYVVKDQQGEVIGYIITTDEHYPSNSLHDGSGITYYLDTDYKIVEKISWAG